LNEKIDIPEKLYIHGKVINKKKVGIPNLLVEVWDVNAIEGKDKKQAYPFCFSFALTKKDGSFDLSISNSRIEKTFHNWNRDAEFSFKVYKGKVKRNKEFKKKKQLRDTQNTLIWTRKMKGKRIVINVDTKEEKPAVGLLSLFEDLFDSMEEISEDFLTAFEEASIETLEEVANELEEGDLPTIHDIGKEFSNRVRNDPRSQNIIKLMETDPKTVANQLKGQVVSSILKEVLNQRENEVTKPQEEKKPGKVLLPPVVVSMDEPEFIQLFHDLADNPALDGGNGRVSSYNLSKASGLDIETVSEMMIKFVLEGKITGYTHDDSTTVGDPKDDLWIAVKKPDYSTPEADIQPVQPTPENEVPKPLDYQVIEEEDSKEIEAFYDMACCYALLNDTETSIDYLKQAIAYDKKYKDIALEEPAFDNIKTQPQFIYLFKEKKNKEEKKQKGYMVLSDGSFHLESKGLPQKLHVRGYFKRGFFFPEGNIEGEGPFAGLGHPGWMEISKGNFYGMETSRAPISPYIEGVISPGGEFRPYTRQIIY
jgi:hypothetical protein